MSRRNCITDRCKALEAFIASSFPGAGLEVFDVQDTYEVCVSHLATGTKLTLAGQKIIELGGTKLSRATEQEIRQWVENLG